MNEQPHASQEDPVPHEWKTRWYRFRYRLTDLFSRLLRMPRPTDVEQALRHEQWRSLQHGKEQGLGRCPEHPEDAPMMNLHHGNYRCGTCWAADYFRTIDAGPVTDPKLQPLQIIIPTQRPNQVYLAARREGKGEHSAALEAIPRWLVKLREKPKEKK